MGFGPPQKKLTEASRAVEKSHQFVFEGIDIGVLENYSSFGHMMIPKKGCAAMSGGSSSSPKLFKKFPSPSVDPDQKTTDIIYSTDDTRMLSGTVNLASYLLPLVTEKDQVKMNGVDALSLFNEAQKAVNKVHFFPLISLKSSFCISGFE